MKFEFQRYNCRTRFVKGVRHNCRTRFISNRVSYLLGAGEGAARRLDISARAGRGSPWGRGRAGAALTSGLTEVARQHEVCIALAKSSLQPQVHSIRSVSAHKCCNIAACVVVMCFLSELDDNLMHENYRMLHSIVLYSIFQVLQPLFWQATTPFGPPKPLLEGKPSAIKDADLMADVFTSRRGLSGAKRVVCTPEG